MEHKRREPRRQGVDGWVGNYRIDEGLWSECQIIDISSVGIKIEVAPFETTKTDFVGRQITIEVTTPVGASVSVQVAGEIRAVVPTQGQIRLGVELVNLSDAERATLGAIGSILPVAW
ncbi:MAG: PilZ domain-containing protein [Acidimicrobiales bacterium]